MTATLTPPSSRRSGPANDLTETLDSLDSILLAAIVEIESLAGTALTPAVLEERLGEIWRRCYAHYASEHEAALGQWFLRRGQALTTRIYPDAAQRLRLYRSGLPPRLGDHLMQLYSGVREHLLTGADYASWDSDGQFAFISVLVELLAAHPRFAVAAKTPGKAPWKDILRWWIDPRGPASTPSATRVSEWYTTFQRTSITVSHGASGACWLWRQMRRMETYFSQQHLILGERPAFHGSRYGLRN